MKKTILSVSLILFVLSVHSQDSSRINAGWVSLDKAFTQTISVKGSDLEKMPFANLSDAIAAWFFGGYTQPAGLVYVVDGNPVTDVNAYSIYDIDEVTLVQNAVALGTTASGQQEMVVVKTKRGQGKSGLTAVAQSGLVNVSGYHPKAAWYHNFYAGGYHNWSNVSAGVSVNYLRDVFPDTVGGHTRVTPDNLQRLRFRGYIDWRIGRRNLVELSVNYTPQRMTASVDSVVQPADNQHSYSATQRLVVPHLSWHSDLGDGWKNELQAIYLHGRYSEGNFLLGVTGSSLYGDYFDSTQNGQISYHFSLWDRIEYAGKIGGVRVMPALNVSYEYAKETVLSSGYNGDEPGTWGTGPRALYTAYSDSSWEAPKFLFLTPSLDFSYKQAFDVQGGVLIEAGHQHGPNNEQGFPFVTMTLDVLKIIKESSRSSLRLFGSYARRTVATVDGYTLADLNNGVLTPGLGEIMFPFNGISGNTTNAFYPFGQKPPGFGVGEAGISLVTWKERLTVQYTFERRNYMTGLVYPGYYNVVDYDEVDAALHHGAIGLTVVQKPGLTWNTGVNATGLRNRIDRLTLPFELDVIGDVAPARWSWTGGWVNRVRVNGFTAGLDVLYHFGETNYVVEYGGPFEKAVGKRNSVLVPNIYAGYGWKTARSGGWEFFVESRGMIRSSPNDLSDGRRWYTIGGKWGL